MRIVDLFKTWDADNSNSLTRDEFKEGLKVKRFYINSNLKFCLFVKRKEKNNTSHNLLEDKSKWHSFSVDCAVTLFW